MFYNGSKFCPPEKVLKLSDAYLEKADLPMLELSVKVININLPVDHAILEQICKEPQEREKNNFNSLQGNPL